jgi:4-hydroxy-tetrahydrodipicolinate synthase
MGSPASILALGNIAPKMIIEVMDLAKRGDVAGAKKIYYKLVPIARAISDAVNFPAPIKAALTLLGRSAGDPRLPTVPVDAEKASSIREALQTAELL